MSKNRIKRNFYLESGYDFQRITNADREKMTEKEKEYWKDKDYWYVFKSLPDGRLYAGWDFRYPTKLTKDDLPPDYIFLANYKKRGYIRTAGVKSLIYRESPFHNHTFKDDFLYISYTKDLGEYNPSWEADGTLQQCDEYIFGNNIVDFIFAVEKWSPEIDVAEIKERMVDQYNAFVAEMRQWEYGQQYEEIEKLEELKC